MASAQTPEELSNATGRYTSSSMDYLDYAQDYGGNYKDIYNDVRSTGNNISGQIGSGQPIVINVVANVPFSELTAEAVNNDPETQTAVVRVAAEVGGL